MDRRKRIVILVIAVLAILGATLLPYWWSSRPPALPPLPSEQVEAKAEERATETSIVVQSELDCIDRLIAQGVPEGSDPKVEYAKCRRELPRPNPEDLPAPAPENGAR